MTRSYGNKTRWNAYLFYAAAASAMAGRTRPALAQVVSRQTVVDLRIDGATHDLVPIGSMAVSSAGAIVVGQQRDGRVLFFDVLGKAAGRFGRSGEGPGEFAQIRRVGRFGTGIWVTDLGLRRTTLVSASQQLTSTIPQIASVLPPSGASEPGSIGSPFVLAVAADGSLVADVASRRGVVWPSWVGTGSNGGLPLLHLAPDGAFRNLIAWMPVNDSCALTVPRANGSLVPGVPFCSRPATDISDDGSLVGIAVPDAANATGYRVTVISTAGDTVFSRHFPGVAVAIPARLADSAMAERMEWVAHNGGDAQAYRAMLHMPAVFPQWRRILIGRDRTIWMESWQRTTGGVVWHMLDSRGSLVADVTVPANFRVMVAERDMLWGLEQDDNDVESIVRMRLVSGPM